MVEPLAPSSRIANRWSKRWVLAQYFIDKQNFTCYRQMALTMNTLVVGSSPYFLFVSGACFIQSATCWWLRVHLHRMGPLSVYPCVRWAITTVKPKFTTTFVSMTHTLIQCDERSLCAVFIHSMLRCSYCLSHRRILKIVVDLISFVVTADTSCNI